MRFFLYKLSPFFLSSIRRFMLKSNLVRNNNHESQENFPSGCTRPSVVVIKKYKQKKPQEKEKFGPTLKILIMLVSRYHNTVAHFQCTKRTT